MPSGGGNPLVGSFYPDTAVAEDVSQIIYQITPEDTPFYNSVGEGRAMQPFHNWLTRSITTRSDNANHEGFTYTFTGQMEYPDARRFNTCQIINDLRRVSMSELQAKHYAIDDAFTDQMQIGFVKVKTDAELALIQGTLVSGATGTARRMQGILNALVSGITTYTNVTAAASLSETIFNDAIQASWQYGGEPRKAFCGGYMKRKISGFTGGATKFIPTEAQRLVNTVSVYVSDFFPVEVHLCRDIPRQGAPAGYTGYGLLLADTEMIKRMMYRPWTAERAPKIADAMDGVTTGELTLEYGTPLAHHYLAQFL